MRSCVSFSLGGHLYHCCTESLYNTVISLMNPRMLSCEMVNDPLRKDGWRVQMLSGHTSMVIGLDETGGLFDGMRVTLEVVGVLGQAEGAAA